MKTIFTSQILIFLLIFPFLGKSQLVTITGTITDSKNRVEIASGNIFESKINIGTISDRNGFYKLELKAGEVEIKFSADKFYDFTKKLELKNDTSIIVELIAKPENMHRYKKNVGLRADGKSKKSFALGNR
jgi:hypothetical protein